MGILEPEHAIKVDAKLEGCPDVEAAVHCRALSFLFHPDHVLAFLVVERTSFSVNSVDLASCCKGGDGCSCGLEEVVVVGIQSGFLMLFRVQPADAALEAETDADAVFLK